VGVHREQREPGVVALGGGGAIQEIIDVADDEIVVIPAEALAIALRADLIVALHRSTPKFSCSKRMRCARRVQAPAALAQPAPDGSESAARHGASRLGRGGSCPAQPGSDAQRLPAA